MFSILNTPIPSVWSKVIVTLVLRAVFFSKASVKTFSPVTRYTFMEANWFSLFFGVAARILSIRAATTLMIKVTVGFALSGLLSIGTACARIPEGVVPKGLGRGPIVGQ